MEQKPNTAKEKTEKIAKSVQEENAQFEREAQLENEAAHNRVERAKLKKEKKENKEKLKLERKKEKEKIKKQNSGRRGNAVAGWIASVVALGTCVLILATLLTVSLVGGTRDSAGKDMSYAYKANFSDLVDYVDNMDVNLSKLLASKDERQQQKLLGKISEESALAEFDLQTLPIDQQNKVNTAKFINQVGDYAKFLNNRLIDGYFITEEQYNSLNYLYLRNAELKENLISINNKVQSGADVKDLFDGENSFGTKTFMSLESMSVDYPQLIYDGPFSDGLSDRTVKGLQGKKISEKVAEDKVKSYFADYKLDSFEVLGETSGQIKCFNVRAETEDNVEVYAQVSQVGGKLIMFNYAKECKVGDLAEEECIQRGLNFLKGLGIDNMKAVWSETNDKMLTVNYAYVENGVIVYPDLIKLNICREKGEVFGMEAKSYYMNHTERQIGSASLSKTQAVQKVGSDISVQNVRLALVPLGNTQEVLTYEVEGTKDGNVYFIYVDANTGAEVQIFKVVETDGGNLLI